jgi:hypothetical protein
MLPAAAQNELTTFGLFRKAKYDDPRTKDRHNVWNTDGSSCSSVNHFQSSELFHLHLASFNWPELT